MNWSNPISDLTPLSRLTSLRHLNVAGCEISDICPLRTLRNLQILLLGYNRISDITPLANLTHLTDLYLDHNQIVDVRPLQGLIRLKHLEIENNQIADFSPLDGLFIDWWSEDWAVLRNYETDEAYRGLSAELQARKAIIQRTRAAVGEDFLIIVNPNRRKHRSQHLISTDFSWKQCGTMRVATHVKD